MNVDLRYLGRSAVVPAGGGSALRLAPNLARPKVFFDAELAQPVRFREAISALHEVVVGDHRFKKRDKTAWHAWKQQEKDREAQIRQQVVAQAKKEHYEALSRVPMPENLEADFRRLHTLYWSARHKWAFEIAKDDPALFRVLVPCDPVVTVAPDVVCFECFARDESSYGCLTVDRDAFRGRNEAGLGTTNVDYSLALFEHFQTLRSYRTTRLQVDPAGFEVKVEDRADYREEKIDLPPSWLRGFAQLQSVMGLASRRVVLPTEAVYSLLAYLKRHREKVGPRSVRFQLVPGQRPTLVLDPWGVTIPCHGPVYEGEQAEEIKVWGRRRLMVLTRLLPLAERFEVWLLGSGLPSIWIAHLGEMRFTLALSGWTRNDWTSGANLELLTGGFRTDPAVVEALARHLASVRSARLAELSQQVPASREVLLGSLNLLAKQGQLMFDHAAGVYRFRPVLPVVLSEALLGPEHPELLAARTLWRDGTTTILRDESPGAGRRLLVARAGELECEGVLDAEGIFVNARCSCSYFHTSRLRAGPCRHLLAMRLQAQSPSRLPPAPRKWYEKLFS